MQDEVIINLRALSPEIIAKFIRLIDEQLNVVPDDVNEAALETLQNFNEDTL